MYDDKREKMVAEQIIPRSVRDRAVLAAMRKVERHLFVPDDLKPIAYLDEPLPIGYGQTISQPYIVAYMTEALRLKSGNRVLEIGSGSGYQTAILAEIAHEVYTVEVVEPIAILAARRLTELGYANVRFRIDDGYKGWEDEAPFDAIIVTAAPPEVPDRLAGQLNPGGRMVVPVGDFSQELCLITRRESGSGKPEFDKKGLLPVRFVPMVRRD